MSHPSVLDLDPVKAAADPLLGRVIGDRYRIVEEIGSGGMGRVYRALQAPLERMVALKVLAVGPERDPVFARRFFLEASVTARLSHPNTIAVHDYGCTPDGICYLVMEHLSGRTLQEVLEREGPMAKDRAIHIAQQICRSLAEAHAMGVIHRDLKPANVMLLRQRDDVDFAKVLDFGLVKVLAESNLEKGITSRGSFVGSPHYMAPEQARNQNPDQRSDIYSLGVVLYHMLAGAPPFHADSSVEIILRHVLEPPPPLRKTRPELEEPELEAIIHKCLAKERDQRHQSMDELLAELKAVAARFGGWAPGPPPSVAPPRTELPPTPRPEVRTPSRAMPSLPPPPPADADERPGPATLSKEWLEAFRARHQRAKAGELTPPQMAAYERERETLSNALLAAQTLSMKSGGRPRKSVRFALERSIRLAGLAEELVTRTVDLTTGGFAVLLDRPLRAGHSIDFVLDLADGKLAGEALVLNVQRKARSFRVGCAFKGLSQVDATQLQREILDAVLSQAR
ncbi:MAG TPA: serine/threonine-protein kinase [Myxococcales bacterium]|nr:serine/threonine-protein kinase [Myxococcales bacterium]